MIIIFVLLYKQFPVSIDKEKCSKCRICTSICNCFSYDKENDIVSVNSISCKGCGVCIASCPSSAIYHIQDDAFFYLSEKKELKEMECEECIYEFFEKEDAIIFCERRFDMGIAIKKFCEGKKIEVKKCLFSEKASDEEKFRKFSKILHLFGVKND